VAKIHRSRDRQGAVTIERAGGFLASLCGGALDGDSLKLEISRPGRDGNTRTNNAVAKRATT